MALGIVQAVLDFLGVEGQIAIAAMLAVVVLQGKHVMSIGQRVGIWMRVLMGAAVAFGVLLAVGVIDIVTLEPLYTVWDFALGALS
jgi:hypothetical protein